MSIKLTLTCKIKWPVASENVPYHPCGFRHLVDKSVHKHQAYYYTNKKVINATCHFADKEKSDSYSAILQIQLLYVMNMS